MSVRPIPCCALLVWVVAGCAQPDFVTDGGEQPWPMGDGGTPPEFEAGSDADAGSDGEVNKPVPCQGASCCEDDQEWDGNDCAEHDPCTTANGGCDPHAACESVQGEAVCGECLKGFALSAESKCEPALSELEVSTGNLEPSFDPRVTDYELKVGLGEAEVVITASADAQVTIEVDGTVVSMGTGQAALPIEPFAEREVVVHVESPDGGKLSYRVHIERVPVNEQLLTMKTPLANLGFGHRVAISGDRLVVAAEDDSAAAGVDGDETNTDAPGSGAVHVFRFDGSSWLREAYIKASNPGEGDGFGSAVAIDGDLLAVGSTSEDGADDSMFSSGAVYVFRLEAGSWKQIAYLKAKHPAQFALFGSSLALAGGRLVVGADQHPSAAAGVNAADAELDGSLDAAGAVHVFEQDEHGTFTQQAFLKPEQPGERHFFGRTVAVSGSTIAVGAALEGGSGRGINPSASEQTKPSSGAVYVFEKEATGWKQQAYIKASDAEEGEKFGSDVALLGDVLAVGVPAHLVGDYSTGAVYMFERDASIWTQTAQLVADPPAVDLLFGANVALCDRSTLLVGMPGPGMDLSLSGAGLVFRRNGASWQLVRTVLQPHGEGFDYLGGDVACSTSHVALGAPFDDAPESDSGSVLTAR